MSEVADKYLAYLPKSGLRPKSIHEIKNTLSKYNDRLTTVDKPSLIRWRDWVGEQEYSPTYKNLLVAHVRAMANWAAARDLIDLDSSVIGRCLKNFPRDKEAPVVLEPERIQNMLGACLRYPETGRTVAALLLTGARFQEIMGLADEDITSNGVEIGAERSKNRQGRVIPWSVLGPRARKLFVLPFTWSRPDWSEIRKAAGRPKMKVKSLRSTAATYWISRGLLPARTCAALMGHTIAVAERNYWGHPLIGLEGDHVDEWMGIRSAITDLTT